VSFPSGPGFSHNGSIPGFASVMGIQPDTGQVIVILSNDDTTDFAQLAIAILTTA
jgi:hypothetical protein